VADVLEQVARGTAWESIMAEWRGSISEGAIAEAVRAAGDTFQERAQDLPSKRAAARMSWMEISWRARDSGCEAVAFPCAKSAWNSATRACSTRNTNLTLPGPDEDNVHRVRAWP
jgi:hypothetical protein